MELQNFISETLIQIIEGVQDAQKYIVQNNIVATVHPRNDTRGKAEIVEFDVAVTSSENSLKGLKGGITVASILNIGGEDNKQKAEQNISRIKFKVLVTLPHQDNDFKPDPLKQEPPRESFWQK